MYMCIEHHSMHIHRVKLNSLLEKEIVGVRRGQTEKELDRMND